MVWTSQNGISYAGGTDAFTVEQVYDYGFSLRKAGPIGQASVTADADGNPWVAYTVNASGQEVRVATKSDDEWSTQTVATIPQCAGCPQPQPTRIGVTSAGPTVAWVDTDAGAVMVSVLDGDEWVASEVAGGVSGQGLDMAVDADGNGILTFFDDDGGVQLARQGGAGWSLTKIADAAPADPETIGNLAPTTSIAVDDEGGLVAAWDDADGVVLATSDDGETFTPIETADTLGGRSALGGGEPRRRERLPRLVRRGGSEPAVRRPGRHRASSRWRHRARRSPRPSPGPPTTGGGECGADGEILLDIVASGVAWDTSCLVAPAGEAFTVNIDNQDAGIPHNFDLLTEEGGDEIGKTAVEPGPVQQTLDVDPLDAGEYFYVCDVHPTTMTGTLVAIEVGGGGGGGN